MVINQPHLNLNMFIMVKLYFDIYLDLVSKLKIKKRIFVHYFDTNIDIVSKLMVIVNIIVKLSIKLMILLYKILNMVKHIIIVFKQELKNKVIILNLDINLYIVSKLMKKYLLIPIKIIKQNAVHTNTRKAFNVN